MTEAQRWLEDNYENKTDKVKNKKEIVEEIKIKKGTELEGELTIDNYKNLKTIILSGSKGITKLFIKNCPNVEEIDIYGNKIEELEGLDQLPNLKRLIIQNNQIKQLNLSSNVNLEFFICFDNTGLKIVGLENLSKLYHFNGGWENGVVLPFVEIRKKELDKLKSVLTEKETEINDLEKQLEETKQQLTNQKAQDKQEKDNLAVQLDKEEKNSKTLMEKLSDIEKNLSTTNKTNAELKESLNQIKKENQRLINLDQKLVEIQQKLQQSKGEKNAAEQNIQALQNKINNLLAEKQTLIEEITELRNQLQQDKQLSIEEKEQLQTELKQKEEQLADSSKKINESQFTLNNEKRIKVSLEEKCTNLESQVNEVSEKLIKTSQEMPSLRNSYLLQKYQQLVRELKELELYLEHQNFLEWKDKINQLKEVNLGSQVSEGEKRKLVELVDKIITGHKDISRIFKEKINDSEKRREEVENNLKEEIRKNDENFLGGGVKKLLGKDFYKILEGKIKDFRIAQDELTKARIDLETIEKILSEIESHRIELQDQLTTQIEISPKNN